MVSERQLLNTLYLMRGKGYAHLRNENVEYKVDGAVEIDVPLHHLGAIYVAGEVRISPPLLKECGNRGISITFLDRNGGFRGEFRPPTSGNVLLRVDQFDGYRDTERTTEIARSIVAGKVENSRTVLAKRARDASGEASDQLNTHADKLKRLRRSIAKAEDVDALRGYEGTAARIYFSAFDALITNSAAAFNFDGRVRRPPTDPVNSLLSFLYTILLNDCRAAAEGVGLDPQIGFLHDLRPGRPSLALDLMEEFRAPLADRTVLTMINRQELDEDSFHTRPGGSVYLEDEARKKVLIRYQKRKQTTVRHPLLDRRIEQGLLPHLQARLLARHLRGDLEAYEPFRIS